MGKENVKVTMSMMKRRKGMHPVNLKSSVNKCHGRLSKVEQKVGFQDSERGPLNGVW